VLRHHHISIDAEAEAAAHALERDLKDSSARVERKQRMAVITTEGYEMALPGVLITRKAPRHELMRKVSDFPTQGKRSLE